MQQNQDRSTFVGLILIAILFIIYSTFLERSKPAVSEYLPNDSTSVENSIADVDSTAITNELATNDSSTDSIAKPPMPKGPFLQSSVEEEFHVIENEEFKLTFSNKGGRIYRAELKKYSTFDSLPLVLIDGVNNEFSYSFGLGTQSISTQKFIFDIAAANDTSIVYRLYSDSTKTQYIEQNYSLSNTEYMVDYDYKMVGFDSQLANGKSLVLMWRNEMFQQEKDFKTEQNNTTIYYKENQEDPDYCTCTEDVKKDLSAKVDWISFKQQFFNTSLIADNSFYRADLDIHTPRDAELVEDKTVVEVAQVELGFEYTKKAEFSFPMKFYIGPNEYSRLNKLDNDLEALVPLGWGIFRWVNKLIIIPMFNFLHNFIGNYGIIILVLTVVIKLVLFPLTYRSYKSFAKMNVLKPEIEAIKEKHKDPQKIQQETMKLYGKTGVNPLGGCLPQMLQFPILIAMYRFFPSSIELRQEPFLWADDLSSYDSILNLPFNIPFYGDHVSLFCLLSAISSLLYMRLNSQMTPSAGGAGAAQMKMMQYMMPFMLLFFFNSFSAGLTYYFFLSNIISFGQQYAIKNYFIDEEAIHKQLQSNKKKPPKKSKFQERLQKMMEEQEAQKRGLKGGNKDADPNAETKRISGTNRTKPKKRKK
ncbi:MAG: membrane protein insertase YidC [Chitinophagales bacterium]